MQRIKIVEIFLKVSPFNEIGGDIHTSISQQTFIQKKRKSDKLISRRDDGWGEIYNA